MAQLDLQVRDDLPSLSFIRHHNSPIATKAQAQRVLEKIWGIGIKPTKLAKLLGTGNSAVVFNWKSGRQSPSQPYCLRIIYLLCLAIEGIPLSTIRTINWNTYEIEWLKGMEPNADSSDAVAYPFRAVPQEESEDNV